MKVIFLDIDGVLNHPGTYADDSQWRDHGDGLRVPVAPECMLRLNRLVAETGAKIVISSSWRMFARWQDLGPALQRHGLVGDVIGETPVLRSDQDWLRRWRFRRSEQFTYERLDRGWEITEYLRDNWLVISFVILDDCSDMAGVKSHLVHVDAVTGLDDSDVERAKWILNQTATQADTLYQIDQLSF